MTVRRSELKWSMTSESEGPSDGIMLYHAIYVFGYIFTGTLPKSLFKIGLLIASRYDDY